jgi:hypothetical protein
VHRPQRGDDGDLPAGERFDLPMKQER